MAGCVNAAQAIVCFGLPAREASSFCDFIYLLFDWGKILIFQMCLLRINLPNLCPNMNHFDAVNVSECDYEEVVSFFWRSVYILLCYMNFTYRPAYHSLYLIALLSWVIYKMHWTFFFLHSLYFCCMVSMNIIIGSFRLTVSKEDSNLGRIVSLRMRKLIFLPKLPSPLLTVVNRKLPIDISLHIVNNIIHTDL